MTKNKIEVTQRTQYIVKCPVCEYEWDLTYLINQALTYGEAEYTTNINSCDDCGSEVEWEVFVDRHTRHSENNNNFSVSYKVVRERIPRRLVLLDLNVDDLEEPIQIVTKGSRSIRDNKSEQTNFDEYFYDESACPINYLQDTLLIIEGEDTDPHGLFTFNKAVDLDDDLKKKICNIGLEDSYDRDDWEIALRCMNASQVRALFEDNE